MGKKKKQNNRRPIPVCTTFFMTVLHTTALNTIIPEDKTSKISVGAAPVAPLPLLLEGLSWAQLMQATWAIFSFQARIYLQPIYSHSAFCQQGSGIFSSSQCISTPHCERIQVWNPYQLYLHTLDKPDLSSTFTKQDDPYSSFLCPLCSS